MNRSTGELMQMPPSATAAAVALGDADGTTSAGPTADTTVPKRTLLRDAFNALRRTDEQVAGSIKGLPNVIDMKKVHGDLAEPPRSRLLTRPSRVLCPL